MKQPDPRPDSDNPLKALEWILPHEPGKCNLSITAAGGKVRIEFDQEVSYLLLTPGEAAALAEAIRHYALRAEKGT